MDGPAWGSNWGTVLGFSKRTVGIGMVVELTDIGLDTAANSGGFSSESLETAGGTGGEGSTGCTAEAIFLNFL